MDQYQSMFLAAVQSLAEISKALGIPDEEAACANGNALILEAIDDLKQLASNGEALARSVLSDQAGRS